MRFPSHCPLLLRHALVLVVAIMWLFPVLRAQETALYAHPRTSLMVGKHMAYVIDPSGKMTFEEIRRMDTAGGMLPVGQTLFLHPASEDYFWFRLTVINQSGKDALLEMESAFGWYIDFYAPDSTGAYGPPLLTGSMRGEASKPYPVNTFWFPLNTTRVPQTYYLRAQMAGPVELPFRVGSLQALYQNKRKNDFLAAGFVGVVLITFLYNLFMMLFLREKQYLVYLFYLLTLFTVPYLNNYPFIAALGNSVWWHQHSLFWVSLGVILIAVMAIVYLDLRRRLPVAWYGLLAMIGVLCLTGLSAFTIGKNAAVIAVFQPVVMVVFLICLFSSCYLALKRVPQAMYYVLGWTFMFGASGVYVLTVNGLLPYHFLTRNAAYFGATMEIWLFSVALASRFNALRREKMELRQANIRMLRDQNIRLEEAVQARTQEIEARNASIRQQADQLEAANATQLKLFSIISHDMRQPVSSLKGLMQLVVSGTLPMEKFQEMAPAVLQRVTTLSETLDNLLQWAFSQMRGQSFNPEVIEIHGIIAELMVLYGETASSKHILLECAINQPVYVLADGNHVRLVLRNLLNNALKFTGEQGRITLSARHTEEMVHITVSDTGVGMPQEQADALFSLEHTVSSTGTQGETGVGLGLPLCREVVMLNGGSISAQSAPGKGTAITFSLMQAGQ